MNQEKIIKSNTCIECASLFEITDKDLEFYDKVSPKFGGVKYQIPEPKLCPECRVKRRLSFFNYRNLYKNICLQCNKEIVSRFSKESGIKNYCNECWSNEDWDQLAQGVDIDFNVSFFSQIDYLIKNTYFQNLIGSSSNVTNNAVYTNHTSDIHNSYFVFEANNIDESYYGYNLKNSKHVVDSMYIGNSEYVYECVNCYNMYNVFYSKNSFGSKFSYFLDSCYNCSYCIGCVNLINKDYHLFNKSITKSEYEDLINKLQNYSFLKDFKKKMYDFSIKQIKKSNSLIGTEYCSGDNIVSSNNCINCFDTLECKDSKYCNSICYSNDLFDVSGYGEDSNLMYDSVSVGRYSNNILFSSIVGKGEKLIYCIDVKKSQNCFGCVNLEGKQYCILNKQYTKEEYEKLVPKIIEHMKKNGEWGEFFPVSISPFCYNETLAQEYFPLGKDVALQHLYKWSDYEAPFPKVEKIIPANKLPENIKGIPDDILNWAIMPDENVRNTDLHSLQKPFRIIKQELEFYRKHNLPIPRKHPNERHLDRMKQRNERKIYDRKCDKCGVGIKTTFSPNREEIVYCEDCYNKEVY